MVSDTNTDNPPQHDEGLAVEMQGISKFFGGVKALVDVDFELKSGEIHALLGGNGAGKSTILKILNGVHTPDKGSVKVHGMPVSSFSPQTARDAGIAMIYQEMSLVPTLTVAQNVFLNREIKGATGLVDDESAEKETRKLFDLLEVDIDPTALVEDLGAGQKQLTEIVKAISQNARILILDEPSTALSVEDVERLFSFLNKLQQDGVSIIYVSHRMDEISRIADRATIFRDGRHIISAPISELPIDTIIEHIVGQKSFGLSDISYEKQQTGETLLELNKVSGKIKPRNVTLKLAKGEVVGLAGLLGSGRSSLARLLFGLESTYNGEMKIKERPTKISSPEEAIASGIALVPEARATQGIIASHSVKTNLTLATLNEIARRSFISDVQESTYSNEQITGLSIKTESENSLVSTLSGGNQQKVVIGKWLATDPDLLILDEPTAGIDIGSKSEIILLIRQLAKAGKTILMISSELSELLSACDRFVVMSEGEITGDYPRDTIFNDELSKSNTLHQLQAAEQKLQLIIQQAISEQGVRHVS
ncbi:sugar ABC transporter ATP-binding protein [Vibrio sp. SCSIO 43132]|uniref:sugar ABC transporter ATP-binding protein n=1 Tax=Vibrio sp. SCSIO 43132 TaxID=2779363 RepID=UPI001CA90680|nr:sugar ABC transporter ATP-binding protein [Vibrio sp. SCSIO 43132]